LARRWASRRPRIWARGEIWGLPTPHSSLIRSICVVRSVTLTPIRSSGVRCLLCMFGCACSGILVTRVSARNA
jgi:hypothetical protein